MYMYLLSLVPILSTSNNKIWIKVFRVGLKSEVRIKVREMGVLGM